MEFKQQVVTALQQAIGAQLDARTIAKGIEIPKSSDLGDYAFPTFMLAKIFHKAPQKIAEEIVGKIDQQGFEKVQAVGAYVNFFLDKQSFSRDVLQTILVKGDSYGNANTGHGGNVPIDMSSPNIAKPMSMGHLRSTVIGNSLANILRKIGYNPIKINHLGDWGTQFGKLIVGYKKWGSEADVKADPITNLNKYYVRFHKEDVEHPELDDEAREWFKKLENGDPEAMHLWKWFREISLSEFSHIYDVLGIEFDSYKGEAFYNDKMDAVIQELEEKHLLEESQGAEVVNLDSYNLSPAMIRKSDGASLYMTRDLAAAIYRMNTYNFVQSLYVVGNEQALHFDQLKAVLKEMGDDWADNIHHIAFGLITSGGKKLSTRKGNVILLEGVLKDAVLLAQAQIEAKNPTLKNKDQVAKDVGVGAVVFHDLKNDRMDSFDFNLEEVVRFEGETGPYVQYTNARAQSILRKAAVEIDRDADDLTLTDPEAWNVLKALGDYPAAIERAAKEYEPSVIAKYTLRLAKAFNQYYAHSKILEANAERNARLALVDSVSRVLQNALALLGVNAPSEM
ncbi:arginine--tRNA ligase [Lactobacillus selangorensis]|nr:arginine--tRNA ligase [Lactobacillus selangorensis]